LVVANRLGCVNHAWLTVRELERRALPLAGWILNEVSSERTVASETNLETLTSLLGPPIAVRGYQQPAVLDPRVF
ncbi:MAG: dethiobiotin synthase, partial [Candidatus Dadabacteria bacterium]